MVAGKGNNPLKRTNEKTTQKESCSLRLIICCESQLSFECLKMQVAEGCGLGGGFRGVSFSCFKGDKDSGWLSSNSDPSRLSCSWLLSREASVTNGGVKSRSSLLIFGVRTKGTKEREGEWWNGFTVCVLSSIIKAPFRKRLFAFLPSLLSLLTFGSQFYGRVVVFPSHKDCQTVQSSILFSALYSSQSPGRG